MSFSWKPGEAWYVPFPADQAEVKKILAQFETVFNDPKKKWIGQNLKYDKHVLANHGIALNGIAHDTLLQSYVLESHRSHGMDDLAMRHLGVQTITFEEVAGKGAKQVLCGR